MRHKILSIALSLLITSFAAAGGEVPFEFAITAPGGRLPVISSDPDGPEGPMLPDGTTGFSLFTLSMNDHVPAIGEILSLELVLSGLTHTQPDDLDIFLFSPHGAALEVMSDRGDQESIVGTMLVFSDLAKDYPPLESALIDEGVYLAEGTNGFSNFYRTTGPDAHPGSAGGPGNWLLFIIDDSQSDIGELGSWTLRGTAVPEPVTLSLLALGAVTILRRRRA